MMELPDVLVDRMVAVVQVGMPDGLTVTRSVGQRKVLYFRADPALASSVGSGAVWGVSQVGVRNRDGVSPQSIAWAMWMVLDSTVRMSKRSGLPWAGAGEGLNAYAESANGVVRSWVADDAGFRVDLPLLDLTGIEMQPPSGGRLPFPLTRKHRLPETGVITAPNNRQRGQ